MKRKYELVVILNPDLKSEEQEKLLTRVKKLITEGGSEVTSSDLGKKDLAFPIKKNKSGHFWLFEFESQPQAAVLAKQKLQAEEGIIRFLLAGVDRKNLPSEKKRGKKVSAERS